ncbi:MAG: hypothetical protein M1819_006210 [Sarea resinae]|nr:MAG: hypothetical protein M1819_006210 [Sarea resinae]
MSASLAGNRELPQSRHDLNTYWGRVKHTAEISDPRTLLVSASGLENAKKLVSSYKQGQIPSMTPELWQAKKVVDSTLHPDTGEAVFLPFRMSCFVLSNLVVTAGMLQPGLQTTGTLLWQIVNQSLNVAINNANANKSTPLSTSKMAQSYLIAVSASCTVALGLNSLVPRLRRVSPSTRIILTRLVPFAAVASAGALNVFLMRGEEIKQGIDVYAVQSSAHQHARDELESKFDTPRDIAAANSSGGKPSLLGGDGQQEPLSPSPSETNTSLGKSRKAATLAVGETALSRVLNATPIMVIPPLILVRLQQTEWLRRRPRMTTPINLGLILTTSLFALPLALAAFPQRQAVSARSLEPEFWEKGGEGGMVEFNRGI